MARLRKSYLVLIRRLALLVGGMFVTWGGGTTQAAIVDKASTAEEEQSSMAKPQSATYGIGRARKGIVLPERVARAHANSGPTSHTNVPRHANFS